MSVHAATKVEKYFAAWAAGLALLLSRLTSGNWQVETVETQDYAPLAGLRITAGGGLGGQQSLGLSALDIAELLHIFLGEEVSAPSELDQMQREALEELVRQWAGLVASVLKPDFGEVTCEVEVDSSNTVSDRPTRLFRVRDGERAVTVQMTLDDVLTSALAEPAVAAPVQDPVPAAAGVPPASPGPVLPHNKKPSPIEELLRQGNLDLLMDVELGVTLRFGRRHTSLHEVLDLATGAVLELDREIQEPVDLVLNGRVIARGEVVVVDGNYGLRVSEVASAQRRVGSL